MIGYFQHCKLWLSTLGHLELSKSAAQVMDAKTFPEMYDFIICLLERKTNLIP